MTLDASACEVDVSTATTAQDKASTIDPANGVSASTPSIDSQAGTKANVSQASVNVRPTSSQEENATSTAATQAEVSDANKSLIPSEQAGSAAQVPATIGPTVTMVDDSQKSGSSGSTVGSTKPISPSTTLHTAPKLQGVVTTPASKAQIPVQATEQTTRPADHVKPTTTVGQQPTAAAIVAPQRPTTTTAVPAVERPKNAVNSAVTPYQTSQAPVNPYTNLNTLQKPTANSSLAQSSHLAKAAATAPGFSAARPLPVRTSVVNGAVSSVLPSTTAGAFSTTPTQARVGAPGTTPAPQSARPMPTSAAQAQYNLAVQAQARAAALAGQTTTGGQMASNYAPQYIRPQPGPASLNTPATYIKPEGQISGSVNGAEPMKVDGASDDMIDEAGNERTRLENRERKKRWREQNEDRNKDNDLRCRVNKRANKLYGKERSEAKSAWIAEEFNKRKSKRQEKEGKGPDGNLLIEGTDLSSLNHFEMVSGIMSTLSDIATNPAAPPLKDNPDLNSLLHKLRMEPQSIRNLFTGQNSRLNAPFPNSLNRGSVSGSPLTSGNMQIMETQQNERQMSSVADDDDEEDDDKYSQAGSLTTSVVDINANSAPGQAQTVQAGAPAPTASANATQVTPNIARPATDRTVSANSMDGGYSHHQTYGIGNGFEPQVALTFSSDFFRLISMQPADRRAYKERQALSALEDVQASEDIVMQDAQPLRQEIEA